MYRLEANWNYTSRHIVKAIKKDGWFYVHTQDDHWQFKHQHKKGKVTVPRPKKSMGIKTIRSILKQAGLTEEELIKCLK